MSPAETQISLDDYLRRNYENERECEFVDGLLEERTGGELAHSVAHGQVAYWFADHETEWNIRCAMSYSMWVSPSRIRIPDIVVMVDKLREKIRITPPSLCVEILAPEDHLERLLPRLEDIAKMGVENLWLIDPIDRTAFVYIRDGLCLVDTPRLAIPNSPIYLDLPELFSALD